MSLTHRNVMVTLELCHRLAGPMRERRRGGLLLVGSGAGRVGAAQIAVYSGTKAFERNLAEGLWRELRDFGVDVSALALRGTATPALLRRLDAEGITLEGLDDPADVARLGLARLGTGPEYAVHEEDGWIEDWWSADSRRRQVEEASERSAAYFERRPSA